MTNLRYVRSISIFIAILLLVVALTLTASCTSTKKEAARPKQPKITITEIHVPETTSTPEGENIRLHIPSFALDIDADGVDELVGKTHKGDICIFKRGKGGYRKVAEGIAFEGKKNPELVRPHLLRTATHAYTVVYAVDGLAGSKATLLDLGGAKLTKVWTSEKGKDENIQTTGGFPGKGFEVWASGIDTDGDGKGEVAALKPGERGRIFEWDGATFVPERSLPALIGCVHGMAFADVDGDEKAELIVTGHGFGEPFDGFAVYRQSKGGWKRLKVDTKNRYMQESLAVGDIDGDGAQEVVAAPGGSFTIYGYKDGALIDRYYKTEDDTDTPPYGFPRLPYRVILGDISGDGADELVTIVEKGAERFDKFSRRIPQTYRIALHAWREGTLVELISRDVEATLLWNAIPGEKSIFVPYITIDEEKNYHLKIAEVTVK